MGYDFPVHKTIANNCFLSTIKTLEGMNNIIQKLYKLGIVSLDAYNRYLSENLAQDKLIKEVIDAMHLARNVNNADRSFYRVWTVDWGFSHEIIMYGATLTTGTSNAMSYLNKILANWNSAGLKSLDKVKAEKVETNKNDTSFIHNNYTKEQISSFLTNLDEVEV